MLNLKVEGYKEAKAILDDLPANMQKRMLISALRKSASPMLKSAKNQVPVKSGTLKKQLRIIRFKDRNAPKSEVAIAIKPVFDRTKKKGAINQFYGKFIHEGTNDPRVSKKGKLLVFENKEGEKVFTKSVKGIRKTPFLESAYKQDYQRTISSFGEELARAVENFVRKNFKPLVK